MPALTASAAAGPPGDAIQELFIAAAQQLSLECAARVDEVQCWAGGTGGLRDVLPAMHRPAATHLVPHALQAECRAAELEARLQEATGAFEGSLREAGEDRAELSAARQLCAQAQTAVQELLATNLRLHDALAKLVERQVDGGISSGAANGDSGAAAAAAAIAWTERQRQQHQHQPTQQAPARRRAGLSSRPASRDKLRSTEDEGPAVEEASGHMIRVARPNAPAARPLVHAGRCTASVSALSRARKAAVPPAAHTAKSAAQQALAPAADERLEQEDSGASADAPAAAPSDAVVEAALRLVAQHRELHAAYQELAAELQQLAAAGPPLGPARAQLAALKRQGELQAQLRGLSERLEDGLAQLSALRRAGLL